MKKSEAKIKYCYVVRGHDGIQAVYRVIKNAYNDNMQFIEDPVPLSRVRKELKESEGSWLDKKEDWAIIKTQLK